MKKAVFLFLPLCLLTLSITILYLFRLLDAEISTLNQSIQNLHNDTSYVLKSLETVTENEGLIKSDIQELNNTLMEFSNLNGNEYDTISKRMLSIENRLVALATFQHNQNDTFSSIDHRVVEAFTEPEIPVLTEIVFDRESAKEEALNVIEKYPNDCSALTRLGEISFEEGDWDSAAHYFEKVLELDPSNTTVLNGLGRLSLQMGDYDRSVYIFNRLARQQSDNPVHLYILSKALFLSGKLEEAKSAIEKSLSLNENSILSLNLAGRIFSDSGYVPEAVLAFEKSLSIKEDPDVLATLGDIYIDEREYRKALDCLETSLKLYDGKTLQSYLSIDKLYGQMAFCALQLSDLDKIEKYFRETENYGGSEEVHYFYILSLRTGEDDEALLSSVKLFHERYPDSKYQSNLALISTTEDGA